MGPKEENNVRRTSRIARTKAHIFDSQTSHLHREPACLGMMASGSWEGSRRRSISLEV